MIPKTAIAIVCLAASLLGSVPAKAQAPSADPSVRRLATLLSLMVASAVCEAPLAAPTQAKLEEAISTAGEKQSAITPQNMNQVMESISTKFAADKDGNCAKFKALDVDEVIDSTMAE